MKLAIWVIISLTAVSYGLVAIEYMWKDFVPSSPRIQDSLYSAVVSADFAYGHGSVSEVAGGTFSAQREVMLLHTVAGGLALMLCVPQFMGKFRRRRPALHRRLGQSTLVLVAVSMVFGAVKLCTSPPDMSLTGSPGNTAQLWLLWAATSGSAALAYVSARRKDYLSHQAWMILMFSMLLTAPLLRFFELMFGLVWNDVHMVEALWWGAVVLAVASTGGAALAQQIVLPVGAEARRLSERLPDLRIVMVLTGVTGLGASFILGFRIVNIPGFDSRLILCQLLPVAVLSIVFGVMYATKRTSLSAHRWQNAIYFCAIALVPTVVNVAMTVVEISGVPSAEAYYISAMGAAPLPIFAGLLFFAKQRAGRHESRSTSRPSTLTLTP
ncbi:DUF2306 domain-containing protein [Nocardia mexicana]|nr:DUF2306 domain-containing protein [Nocardia mexicana]